MDKPPHSEKLLIACDLDGTLISINSYRHWVIASVLVALLTAQIGYLGRVFQSCLGRLDGSLTRWDMKRMLIRSAADSGPLRWFSGRLFSKYVRLFTRRNVLAQIKKSSSPSATTFMVTAAWEMYCNELLRLYGFDRVISTKTYDDEENIGINKVKSISKSININNNYKIIVLTDHHDDIPLAKLASEVYLVSPTSRSINEFRKKNIEFEII